MARCAALNALPALSAATIPAQSYGPGRSADWRGLAAPAIAAIQQVLARHPEVETAILYGSRALGRHRPASE